MRRNRQQQKSSGGGAAADGVDGKGEESNNNGLVSPPPPPSLSNLYPSSSGTTPDNEQSRSVIRYPNIPEHKLRVPSTESILTKHLPFSSPSKKDKTKKTQVQDAGTAAMKTVATQQQQALLKGKARTDAVAVQVVANKKPPPPDNNIAAVSDDATSSDKKETPRNNKTATATSNNEDNNNKNALRSNASTTLPPPSPQRRMMTHPGGASSAAIPQQPPQQPRPRRQARDPDGETFSTSHDDDEEKLQPKLKLPHQPTHPRTHPRTLAPASTSERSSSQLKLLPKARVLAVVETSTITEDVDDDDNGEEEDHDSNHNRNQPPHPPQVRRNSQNKSNKQVAFAAAAGSTSVEKQQQRLFEDDDEKRKKNFPPKKPPPPPPSQPAAFPVAGKINKTTTSSKRRDNEGPDFFSFLDSMSDLEVDDSDDNESGDYIDSDVCLPSSSIVNKNDDDDDDDDEEDTVHSGNKKQQQQLAAAATTMPTSLGSKPKQSLLDDDDDDDDDDDNNIGPPRHSVAANPPPVWGRKAKKASLEDDTTPDRRQLAFAEASAMAAAASSNNAIAGAGVATTAAAASLPPSAAAAAATVGYAAAPATAVAAASLPKPARPPAAAAAGRATYHRNSEGSSDGGGKPMATNGDRHNKDFVVDATKTKLSEEEQLALVLQESKNQLALESQQQRPITTREVEEAKGNARDLRGLADESSDDDVDLDFVETVLSLCRQDQRRVANGIEAIMTGESSSGAAEDVEMDFDVLIDLNNIILDAIKKGENIMKDYQKPAHKKQTNLDVEELVMNKDIFSLICMLRVHQNEKRLDAALALMNFARCAEQDPESRELRDEIRSSGGLHTLLSLFRTPGVLYELKVVTALAVAYLLPSYIESSNQTPPSSGLKIIECLRFLVTARSVAHNGELLTEDEMFKASAMALTSFWVNLLEPLLRSTKRRSARTEEIQRTSSVGRQQRGRVADQRREAIALDELLEMTVSLVIQVAKHDLSDMAHLSDEDSSLKWSQTLIEQVCAVEAARPIAVREGILQILVSWIRSNDREKLRTSASALRYVTAITDKYTAGWIHSEMVNKGAVQGIAELTRDITVTREVRLAVTQILSSLCAASHTRAAVVEENCVSFLIGILYEHNDPSSQEIAYYAGNAILRLVSGAITRASAFTGDEMNSIESGDKRNTLLGDIVESGAISSFVSIAKTSQGRLRSVAIQALRAISEDVNPVRSTRLQLCEDSAADALGVTLKDSVSVLDEALRSESEISPMLEGSVSDLHEALCGLANILDPAAEGYRTTIRSVSSSSSFKDPQHVLIKGCIEITDSGGLESLLAIASLPFGKGAETLNMDLLDEACRSLALMAPILLTSKAEARGYSKWAHDVFHSLHCVLKKLGDFTEGENDSFQEVDLRVNVLQGLGALAKSAPLKVRIIDQSLPLLLQARNCPGDISMTASQTFQSLDLAEDAIAAQVAGNSPTVFVEWFCLQRYLLLQAMARTEIQNCLQRLWQVPFQDTTHGLTELIREISTASCNSDDEQSALNTGLFGHLANDSGTVKERELLISQYQHIYGCRYADGVLNVDSTCLDEDSGLLQRQAYPLCSCDTETKWILDHRQSMIEANKSQGSISFGTLTGHVDELLKVCFPSALLRDRIIPVNFLRPEASFNFRALMMAQRKYFSFRREGQLLSRLCDREAETLATLDIHWSLAFTNSSFAGEFSESLVQVLYKCPMIRSLSFVRNTDWVPPTSQESANEKNGDSGGALLANLVGQLPPWISHVTFEGFFDDIDLRTLVFIFETMGRLAAERESSVDSVMDTAEIQGKFDFFAIRRSADISADAWRPFFALFGGYHGVTRGPSTSPLTSLKALDLSGNDLGDELCGSILEVVHDQHSASCLEELDLSGNSIHDANKVLQVLRAYCHRRSSKKATSKRSWKSSLHTLHLGSNGLRGKVWLQLVSLVQQGRLELRSLDLQANDLSLGGNENEFANVVVQALCSTPMELLNISHNNFSDAAIDYMIGRLKTVKSCKAIVLFEGNTPSLSDAQKNALVELMSNVRKRQLHRYVKMRDAKDGSLISSNTAKSEATGRDPSQIKSFETSTIPEDSTVATFPSSRINKPRSDFDNSITVLFSAPLVFADNGRRLHPIAKLDFEMERELMWQCLKEASRDISLSFDCAYYDRLLATITKRCSCLHYSGHGHQEYLAFENGGGAADWMKVDKIKSLIEREGGAPFRFVFVSACYSYLAGETFASAGVPHVVCCQQESELKDTAALAFTRQFYLALAIGHTVKHSFEQGCKAVRATPNLRSPDEEMKKFLLLPQDGDHDVAIFNAGSIREWPKHLGATTRALGRRRNSARSVKSMLGGARSSELSLRNMMQEDPSPTPPQFFLGREIDMYYVLREVLNKKLVSVIGSPGIGRSSLVCALCHYINERASTMLTIERIYYVKARQSRKRNPFRSLVQRFLKRIIEEEKAEPIDTDADMETMFDAICRFLKHEKALVVFDRAEIVLDADDANEFPMLLSKLSRETKNIKVLLTNGHELGIPSLGEHPYSLGPLNFENTVRLFANLCPYLHTPADRKKLYDSLVTDGEQAELLATDPGVGEATRAVFSIMGDGVPCKIEKAAYELTKEDFLKLYKTTADDSEIKAS